MEAFHLTHAERCAEIVEMCRRGWARPLRLNTVRMPLERKLCVECEQPFEGPHQKLLCSRKCKDKRDGRQARERMRRARRDRDTEVDRG